MLERREAMGVAQAALVAALGRSCSIDYGMDWYGDSGRDRITTVELSDEVESQHSFKS